MRFFQHDMYLYFLWYSTELVDLFCTSLEYQAGLFRKRLNIIVAFGIYTSPVGILYIRE